MLVAHVFANEAKLLDRRDDDLLALLDEPTEVARPFGMPHGRAHLLVLADGVANLLVEDAPIGDDDDRIEDGFAVLLQRDQLMGQPRDGEALAAARRVLDQVALARPVPASVGQEPAHHVELLIPGPDLDLLGLPRLRVLRRHNLSVVLQNVGEALPGEDFAPQILRPEAVQIGRVAGPALPAAVEGQEPRGLALEVGAEVDLVLIDREVRHAATEPEERLARAPVLLVLPDGIVDGLLGEAVLELEGEDRKAVDEQPDVQRALRVVPAVAKLARHGEAVLPKAPPGLLVVGRGRTVEEVEVVGAVPDAVAQDVDGAALGDLALQAGEELAAGGTVLVEAKGGGSVGLGCFEERLELDQVDAVLAVVVVMIAGGPADAAVAEGRFADGPARRGVARVAGQGLADEAFEAAFGQVGGHRGGGQVEPPKEMGLIVVPVGGTRKANGRSVACASSFIFGQFRTSCWMI